MSDIEKERQLLMDRLRDLEEITIAWPDTDARGTVKQTLNNFRSLLAHYNITIRYNEMTKEAEIVIPGQNFHKDTEANASLGKLRDLCHQSGFPRGEVDYYFQVEASENAYHPVRDWIDEQVWDGRSRLQEFYNTLRLEHDHPLKETLMRKWAVSAVAALYHPNFSCEGVLTFHGTQGKGKTVWVEQLLPRHARNVWNKDAVVIDMGNKDALFKALGYWITELGELDATFRRSDIEALKGFVTEKVDVLRPPYAKVANKYGRRTVMYATVNREDFLQDDENRRFWVLSVDEFAVSRNFDVAQFWAEVKQVYLGLRDKIDTAQDRVDNNEYGWFLSPREREQLHQTQEAFRSIDPIEETLAVRIVPRGSETTISVETLNTTQILRRLGFDRPTHAQLTKASAWLKKQGFVTDRQRKFAVEITELDITDRDAVRHKTRIYTKKRHDNDF